MTKLADEILMSLPPFEPPEAEVDPGTILKIQMPFWNDKPSVIRRDKIRDRTELSRQVFADVGPVETRTSPLAAEQVYWSWHDADMLTVDPVDRDALAEQWLTWPAACCLIAWSTIEGAAIGMRGYREWGGRIWRDPVRSGQWLSIREAGALLMKAIAKGEVEITVAGAEIPTRDRMFLAWEPAPSGEVLEFDSLRLADRRLGPAKVRRDDVIAISKRVGKAKTTEMPTPKQLPIVGEQPTDRAASAREARTESVSVRRAFIQEHAHLLDAQNGKQKLFTLVNARLGCSPIQSGAFNGDLRELGLSHK